MAYPSCPSCNNNTHNLEIYHCQVCNHLFCLKCPDNRKDKPIFSYSCPRCSSTKVEVVGLVQNSFNLQKEHDNERDTKSFEHKEQLHQQNLEQFKNINAEVKKGHEQAARFEAERKRSEEEQNSFANDFFFFKDRIAEISGISDTAVQSYFIKDDLPWIIGSCAQAQDKTADFNLKKEYNTLISHAQSLQRAYVPSQSVTYMENYVAQSKRASELKSTIQNLSEPDIKYGTVAGIVIVAGFLLAAFWETNISRGIFANSLPWLVIVAVVLFVRWKKKNAKEKFDTSKAELQATLASATTDLNQLYQHLAHYHPQFFNYVKVHSN